MSNRGVTKTLELLENLQRSVRDFCTREASLNLEFRTKLAKLRQRRDQATQELTTQLSAELAKTDAWLQTAKEQARSKFQARKLRITEAQQASKRKAIQDVEEKEGRRKHKLQTESLQAKRNRELGLAETEKRFQEFSSQLADSQERLAQVESEARKAFQSFRSFRRLLAGKHQPSEAELADDEYRLGAELNRLLDTTAEDLRRFRKFLLPRLFNYTWLWLFLLFGQILVVPILQQFGITQFSYAEAGASIAGGLVLGAILLHLGKRRAGPLARAIASGMTQARWLQAITQEKAATRRSKELERIEQEFQSKNEWVDQEWGRAVEEASALREKRPIELDGKAVRAGQKNEKLYQLHVDHHSSAHAQAIERFRSDAEKRKSEAITRHHEEETKIETDYQRLTQQLESEWKQTIDPIYQTLHQANVDAGEMFPPWNRPEWKDWTAPARFDDAAKFGSVEVDLDKLAPGTQASERLHLPGPSQFAVPLLLTYPDEGSILFETGHSGREQSLAALNNIVLRLLSKAPPGQLRFTIFDPVGLGEGFSGIMHLADAAEHVINGRIWTQTNQIEQRLAELNDHMEKVIQMYLRNEYRTIAEYNRDAGNIAEKYHFVVIADFPANFSDLAIKRLLSIAASGARCGVFTLIHWDDRQTTPQYSAAEDLRKSSVSIVWKGEQFTLLGKSIPGIRVLLDPPPPHDVAIDFVQKVGLRSRDSNRVEVPFSYVAPAPAERWTLETSNELRVPIGRTGATKLQYLAIGKGTRQHALIAGKTGSGKSTLFHVIITNLALWCSPDQVEFYLVDFKKGVEFKCYATRQLPHARVVAIESDREFGLSVLQRLDDELRRRGELFRKLGVQDIAGYKRAGGTDPIPRSLLMIDEFQEFFVEDDKIAQIASLLLDRIVRQGRAFGIHVLLGSQTLGGAYTVARSTLGQMVIRIALQCNEADGYLIMDDSNAAPCLLSRPGEGIYNDTAGTVEGNSPFQTVWLSDEERDRRLAEIRELANQTGAQYARPVVFEGNAPAEIAENVELRQLLHAPSIQQASAPRIWLGEPNSIKGPTEVVFKRQSGSNLLIVGQRDEEILAMLSISLISLAGQFPPGKVRFVFCDGSTPGSPARDLLERVVRSVHHPVMMVSHGDLTEVMRDLVEAMKTRTDEPSVSDGAETFLFIHGLQKYKKLRFEEDFNFSSSLETLVTAGAQLNTLICEGARLGFHVVVTCDTYNNVNRFLSRKAVSEFEMRVLFQMSANDSASLIDSPRASTLGLHRALFYNEHEGYTETFRPYALPTNGWVDNAAKELQRLLNS